MKKLTVVIALALVAATCTTGCSYLESVEDGFPRLLGEPPERYQSGQQYGNGGATACMNGACPVINQPKQWLKPCR